MIKKYMRKGDSMEADGLASTLGNAEAVGVSEKEARIDVITPEELERRRHVVQSVEHDLFERHPRKGEAFLSYCRDCAAAKRRFSFYERQQFITWFHPRDTSGAEWGIDHNVIPVIARLCVERVPQCLPFIKLRPSDFDSVFAERPAYVQAQEAHA